jgi:hypothetical protein
MAKLHKHEDLQAAVQVNGESFITNENSILFAEIEDNSMMLYIKSKDDKTEVKIKITERK